MPRIKCLLALSLLGLNTPVFSQTPSPTPPPPPPVGHVRVWNFSAGLKQNVSMELIGSAKPPPIIARALTPNTTTSYREVPLGTFRVSVHAAAKDLSIHEGEKEILPAATIQILSGSFQTMLLQDDATGPRIFLLNDNTKGTDIPPGGKRLRIFDFATGPDASLKTNRGDEVIAAKLTPGMSQHMFASSPGSIGLVLSNKLPNGHVAEQTIELNYSTCDSISAVIMFDRYGRLTLQAFEDAPKS